MGHHEYGLGRAVTGAIATLFAMTVGDTIVGNNNCKTYMDVTLLLACNGAYGTGRAYLAATGTLRTAKTSLIGHLRLHKRPQLSRGTEHTVGALAYTELACRAA